jgi:hypothetical protein
MVFFFKSRRKPTPRPDRHRTRPRVEALESRLVPYSASTNAWPAPQLITISFAPDGTQLDSNGDKSNLFATFNATFGSTTVWENIILRAAQQWAKATNINFAVVGDDGTAFGSGSYQQGDPAKGDIRIGGFNFGSSTLAMTYLPPPVNNTSYAGDMTFNTGQVINNGGGAGYYDLFTVALHEMGHALGLYHSATVSATMYANYTTVKTALGSDDVAGIRSIYSAGAARSADIYGGTNNSFANAADLGSLLDPVALTAQAANLNINATGTVEYFKLTLPAGASGLTFSAQSLGLSLLEPRLTVYAADQLTVLGTASQAGTTGGTATVGVPGAAAGQTVYVKVQGYDTSAFGTGAYDLSLACGPNALPAVTPPNTQLLDGAVPSFGGGQAIKLNPAFVVDSTARAAQTNAATAQSVAMDADGNYVVVWAAQDQDGSGWNVYAQRYSATGTPLGGPVEVNTTTAGDQLYPSVAMNAGGAFVVTWSSNGQDGSGWGVFAQRYNADGTAAGGEFQVNTTAQGDQMYSAAAMDATGDFVITWSSSGQDGSGWGVFAQRYNADGTAAGGEFQVNATTAGDQMYSSVAMDAAGDFVITWSSNGQDGSGWNVFARRYSADGTAAGGEFQVNTTTQGGDAQASVAMNSNSGDFVIAWAGSSAIYAQRYSAAGAARGGEFQVSAPSPDSLANPAVAVDGNGNFLISWTDYADGVSAGVYAQQFDATGAAVGTQFGVNVAPGGNQQSSALAVNSGGDVVVVWTGSTSAGPSAVFGQHYLLNGASGLAAMTPTDGMGASQTATNDALFSQATALNSTLTAVPSNLNGFAQVITSLGHPSGCTCALCQRLAQALGIANANSDGGYLTLPQV